MKNSHGRSDKASHGHANGNGHGHSNGNGHSGKELTKWRKVGKSWIPPYPELIPTPARPDRESSKNGKLRSPSAAAMSEGDYIEEDQRPPRPKFATPLTDGQARFYRAMERNRICFGFGPPGAGKTHLAIGKAVERLEAGTVDRIILIRPCVGLGRNAGAFLPGGVEAKVAPYMRPLLDELHCFYDPPEVTKLTKDRTVEIAGLEYIQGRTFKRSAVIVDEIQNALDSEVNVLLNRIGEGSYYAIVGDISRFPDDHPDPRLAGRMKQCALPTDDQGGAEKYAGMFLHIPGIARVELEKVDIVRDPLVRAMQEAGL